MLTPHIIMPLFINIIFSIIGFLLTSHLISSFKEMFIKAGLFGMDLCKQEKTKIPESQGVVCGTVYLIIMFIFIPVPFYQYFTDRGTFAFPFHEYVGFLAALLSICCMILLGFADDVFDLKWRHKLLLPTIASLPLLVVYLVTFDLTKIIVPAPFRALLGYSLDIGILYYIYMGMLAVFCTNAINIVAGINGIEVGQGLVISSSVIFFNIIELKASEYAMAHLFSLYFMIPFFAVSFALFLHNKYPAEVFVGDTYCYFAGMSFAVVAILGHFSKTMLLFFIPQIFNFLFSVPQLFRLIPCPRHRLPKLNIETGLLENSVSVFKSNQISLLSRVFIFIFSQIGLIKLKKLEDGYEMSNLTIINAFICIFGPIHEAKLTNRLLILQIFCSLMALIIRYPLARLMYN